MTERQEQHVKTLQKMRNVMIEDDNWGNLQRFIEAVTAGGMAIQRLAEQQKTGEWIYDCRPVYGNPYGHYECSNCKREFAYKENYCPSCGVKMVEPQESEE